MYRSGVRRRPNAVTATGERQELTVATSRRLEAAAVRCVHTAAERAPAELEESMRRLVRSVEQGRCPADEFSDRAVKHGIGPAVSQLARGEL